jgi:hypothetical protein
MPTTSWPHPAFPMLVGKIMHAVRPLQASFWITEAGVP